MGKGAVLLAAMAGLGVAVSGWACKGLSDTLQTGGPSVNVGENSEEGDDRGFVDPGEERSDQRDEERRRTVASVITIEPAPGVAAVKRQRPTWCDGVPREELEKAMAYWATMSMQQMKDRGAWWDYTPKVLVALCASPDDEKVQEQTGHFLQLWVNNTGLTPKQLTPFFRAFASDESRDHYKAAVAESCEKFPGVSRESSERTRVLRAVEQLSLGCLDQDGVPFWVRRDASGVPDVSWHFDAAAEPPSELMRSFVVLRCLRDSDELEHRDMANYAVCGTDARALSGAALEKEVARFPELAKAFARAQHSLARRLAQRYEEVARPLSQSDPAWKAILYDAPARAWKDWKALYARHKKLIDTARAYEEVVGGPSQSKARGCWGDARNHFTEFMASNGVSSVAEARRVLTGPVGAILLAYVAACAETEQNPMAAPAQVLLEAARPVRGPRFASRFAIIDALSEIMSDRPKFGADPAWFAGMFSSHGDGKPTKSLDEVKLGSGGGVVKSVQPMDDGFLIHFATERWQEEMDECYDTKQIDRIDSDGTVRYRRKCKSAGKVWVTSEHPSIWLPKDLAFGIKPGAFLSSTPSGMGMYKDTKAYRSAPVEVWTDKSRKKLVALFGVPLSAR